MSGQAGLDRPSADLSKMQKDTVRMCRDYFGDVEHVDRVSDRSIPGPDGEVPVRIYKPNHEGAGLPLMVYYHGGGFCFGSVAGHDAVARRYAKHLAAVVVSVEYRLAPEHSFPAGLKDCYAATVWAHAHASELGARSETLCVAGDSAGGNLAAAVALMARDRGDPRIAFQLLVSPCCDDPRTASYPSYKDHGQEGAMPSYANMIELYDWYLPKKEDGQHAYASPIRAKDLSRLPPALIFTAGKDLLIDEAEAYAAKLADAGVDVSLKRFKDTVHVGMNVPSISARDTKLALALIKAHWEHACDTEAQQQAAEEKSAAKL